MSDDSQESRGLAPQTGTPVPCTGIPPGPDQFAEFEARCRTVEIDADRIANELGWSVGDGESIRSYMRNFLQALDFARAHGGESTSIW
jgi:hypothetical protein